MAQHGQCRCRAGRSDHARSAGQHLRPPHHGRGAAARGRPERVHAAGRRCCRSRGLRGHPGAPARRDQRRAGAHAHRNPAQRAGPGVPLRHGAGGARLQPGPVVGRGGGHHDRHRVPGRAAPHPRRGRGGVEVRGDLLDRDRDGPAGHLPAELRRRTRRDRSGLGRVDRERRRPGPRRHPDRGRAADPRIRDQSRAGPAALLAARRAQPSPRAGVRADVRGAARGRVLRHPARQGHRRRDAGHRFRPHPAGRDRARLPAGGRDRS